MAYYLAPSADARPQFFTSQGAVLAGGSMSWYAAGTTTPQDTFTDSTGGVANANPILLDAAGRPPTGIYLTENTLYKLVVKDSAGNTIFTQDNVAGIIASIASTSEWQSSGLTPTYISGTQFSFPGDQTTDAHVGRRLKIVDSGGTKYATITVSAFTTLTTVTVNVDSGSLATPVTAVSYGLQSGSNSSIPSVKLSAGAWTLQNTLAMSASAINEAQGADIASAGTINLDTATGNTVDVTGTVTITAITLSQGRQRTVRFTGALTLTNGASLVLPGAANITTAAGDFAIFKGYAAGVVRCVVYVKASGKAVINTANTQPTRQTFTSGSGTYTTPANATRIFVRMVGPGGGGGGATANNGANGSAATTFSTFSAGNGGGGAASGGQGTGGGAASGGTVNIPGGIGQGGTSSSVANNFPVGGQGASSVFGGSGGGQSNAAGLNAATNSGAGGGGGGGGSTTNSGAGGSSGGYVEGWLVAPAATYSYLVGAGGNGGAAGTFAGGNGAAGIIIVDEFYD